MTGPKGMKPIREWTASGFRCVIVPAPMKPAINGYVQVPSITSEQAEQVDVHGGVTYGPDSEDWIGFDTLHAGDLWPDSPFNMSFGRERDWDIHWTEDRVAKATEAMAASAKSVIEA